MGAKFDCVERLQISEREKENICCNDDFFSLFRLFSLKDHQYKFSLSYPQKYSYNLPSNSFLSREIQSPPRVLLEVRKGMLFASMEQEAEVSVKVVFHPSSQESTSMPDSLLYPRWYFLAMRTYSSPEELRDTNAVIEVVGKSGVIGRVVLDLQQYEDTYSVFWTPVTMFDSSSNPRLEIRIWNLAHPKLFWDTDSDLFKNAVATILQTPQVS